MKIAPMQQSLPLLLRANALPWLAHAGSAGVRPQPSAIIGLQHAPRRTIVPNLSILPTAGTEAVLIMLDFTAD
jgi:hypothetical protein